MLSFPFVSVLRIEYNDDIHSYRFLSITYVLQMGEPTPGHEASNDRA